MDTYFKKIKFKIKNMDNSAFLKIIKKKTNANTKVHSIRLRQSRTLWCFAERIGNKARHTTLRLLFWLCEGGCHTG